MELQIIKSTLKQDPYYYNHSTRRDKAMVYSWTHYHISTFCTSHFLISSWLTILSSSLLFPPLPNKTTSSISTTKLTILFSYFSVHLSSSNNMNFTDAKWCQKSLWTNCSRTALDTYSQTHKGQTTPVLTSVTLVCQHDLRTNHPFPFSLHPNPWNGFHTSEVLTASFE